MVIRRPGQPQRDVAFAGGIDLCHSRRDDESHRGDPQAVPVAKRYGDHPPWHDVQLRSQGPAVGALDTTFRERWNDPASLDMLNPLAWLRDRLRNADMNADPLPDQPPDPRRADRTPCRCCARIPTLISRSTSRRTANAASRAYNKVVPRARHLIYVEDQYLWSTRVAQLFAEALQANPQLHLVAVIPRYPDVDGRLELPPNLVGRWQALKTCHDASPERVHVFDVENHKGTPVYVHSKVCVVDDIWACVGSDNLNRRSWTHDSELTCAVRDAEGVFARDLRLRLLREHLDRAADGSEDAGLVDPGSAVREVVEAAHALDQWHASRRRGPRPLPGDCGRTNRNAWAGSRGCGRSRCTGWFTIPTVGRGAIGSGAGFSSAGPPCGSGDGPDSKRPNGPSADGARRATLTG